MLNFLVISTLTLIACIGITLLTPATPDAVPANYYCMTRPFGFWRRLHGLIPSDGDASTVLKTAGTSGRF